MTNSFHGAVFSLLFEREVYIEITGQRVRAAMKSRIENLVRMLGIEDRVIGENGLTENTMDYDIVRKRIDKYRRESVGYLKNMLKE